MNIGEHIAELLSRSTPSVEAEKLILATTELILELMEQENINRMELAKIIGKSKGHVSQLLNGKRNMTLRTLAEITYALNNRVWLKAQPLDAARGEDGGSAIHLYHRLFLSYKIADEQSSTFSPSFTDTFDWADDPGDSHPLMPLIQAEELGNVNNPYQLKKRGSKRAVSLTPSAERRGSVESEGNPSQTKDTTLAA